MVVWGEKLTATGCWRYTLRSGRRRKCACSLDGGEGELFFSLRMSISSKVRVSAHILAHFGSIFITNPIKLTRRLSVCFHTSTSSLYPPVV